MIVPSLDPSGPSNGFGLCGRLVPVPKPGDPKNPCEDPHSPGSRTMLRRMFSPVDDVRIDSLRPLIPPAILMQELPLDEVQSRAAGTREQIGAIVEGRDDRLLVVVGPCSIHDPDAGLEYAERLKVVADQWQNELLIVMRTYFEKPRTTISG